MKKLGVFICLLFVAFIVFAQTEATDTITISGRISKIEALQKDWNATNGVSGEKIYQIYWMEFTLPTDSMTGLPASLANNLPSYLVFASPSSGLWSELDHFRRFKIKDKVTIIMSIEALNQFMHNEKRNILVSNIKLF
jgi:hypothetical protein